MMVEVDPDWRANGLPDECPECGESQKLGAHITTEDDAGPVAGGVVCFGCGNAWDWTREED